MNRYFQFHYICILKAQVTMEEAPWWGHPALWAPSADLDKHRLIWAHKNPPSSDEEEERWRRLVTLSCWVSRLDDLWGSTVISDEEDEDWGSDQRPETDVIRWLCAEKFAFMVTFV